MDTGGFYKRSIKERRKIIEEAMGVNYAKTKETDLEAANIMIENVVATTRLPVGIATNFVVNGREILIPMAIEETSVVAAASNAAKIAKEGGGFKAEATEPIMDGQIQFLNADKETEKTIREHEKELLSFLDEQSPSMKKRGGGARRIETHWSGPYLVAHLLYDVRDSMGANTVNAACEALSEKLEELTGKKTGLCILTNLCLHRTVKASATFPKSVLGEETINAILKAYDFAEKDVYRCCTNNKGIMNGIDAVAIATGNDWRALEAGAHFYASLSGRHEPLAKYEVNEKGDLVGTIELPLAVGIVGGSIKLNPVAQANLKVLGVKSARELAEVMACVGLANNFAALKALATEGINRGHMRLHARTIAIQAGAKESEMDEVAKKLVESKNIKADNARKILESIRGKHRK
ncbi:hydroxymethylglutaryl-CoA reductase, degradative [Candidatus Micrarchaeota archaeon CG1_02_55_41]|nr:MAG: hydroxymethylglutaryl-CoA reductase, degradative [Candidatus Micrarchaeota archaeon CG1_02_55_41]